MESNMFKKILSERVIPSLKEMIESERNHRTWLLSQNQNNNQIREFTTRSTNSLVHLEVRLAEYIYYLENKTNGTQI